MSCSRDSFSNIKTFLDAVSPLQFIPRLFDRLVEEIKDHCQIESIKMAIRHP